MTKYLAGVDVGTTGARCIIFDLSGNAVGSHYCEYGATYPKPGWVEQDGEFLVAQTMEACQAAVAKSGVAPKEIAAVGFSTQRSVTIPVDKAGKPVRPMISWQDAAHRRRSRRHAGKDRRPGVLRPQRHADGHDLGYHQSPLDAQERARALRQNL